MTMTHYTGPYPSGFTSFLRPSLRPDGLPGLGIAWLEAAPPEPASRAEAKPSPTLTLARAVAGIVALAAERARDAGELAALREEVQRALAQGGPEPATDPRDSGLEEPPPIADAEPQSEGERLAALMRRQTER